MFARVEQTFALTITAQNWAFPLYIIQTLKAWEQKDREIAAESESERKMQQDRDFRGSIANEQKTMLACCDLYNFNLF